MPVGRVVSGYWRRGGNRWLSVCANWTLAFSQGYVAHFLAIPLLTTPTVALGVNDASAASAAARVFGHRYVGEGE